MRICRLLVSLVAPLCACAVHAEDMPGKKVFAKHCAECHSEGLGYPGTQQLGWTRGTQQAVLEKRADLNADYIKAIVRRGLIEMPPFRPTEISDAELEQLAAYLTKKPAKSR